MSDMSSVALYAELGELQRTGLVVAAEPARGAPDGTHCGTRDQAHRRARILERTEFAATEGAWDLDVEGANLSY